MYENQATAAPTSEGFGFKPRGGRPIVGYAAPAPLPTHTAPQTAMDAVPAAPIAVTAPPSPSNFTSAIGGFHEAAPTEHAPTLAAAPVEHAAPTFEAPLATPSFDHAPAAPAEAPIPSFAEHAPTVEHAPAVIAEPAFPAAPEAGYSPPSFSAAFGNGGAEIPQDTGGPVYAHAPAVEGPLEPLPPQQDPALASPASLSQPSFGGAPTTPAFEAAVASAPEQGEFAAPQAGGEEPQAAGRHSPETYAAAGNLLQLLETEDVKQAAGNIQLHARALKVMLQDLESEAGEHKIYSEGFHAIEKLASGLPKNSDTLNGILDNAEVLLRENMVTSVDVHSARKENALSALAGAAQTQAGIALDERQSQGKFAAAEAERRAGNEGLSTGQYL